MTMTAVHHGSKNATTRSTAMKSIILWLLGVPVSVIILLKIFGVF